MGHFCFKYGYRFFMCPAGRYEGIFKKTKTNEKHFCCASNQALSDAHYRYACQLCMSGLNADLGCPGSHSHYVISAREYRCYAEKGIPVVEYMPVF